MAQAQGSSNKRQFDWDDPVVIISGIAVVAFLIWAIWHFFHTEISFFYIYLRYAQLYPFYIIGTTAEMPPFSWATSWVQQYCIPETLGGFCGKDFTIVQWSEIKKSAFAFNIINFIVIFIAAIRLFIVINSTHPKSKFAKTHNIKTFIKENKQLYPHLKTFGDIDLISKPLDDPKFGMSLSAKQFAFKHRLIAGWKEEEGGFMPILDRAACTDVFTKQLGALWEQVDKLKPSETLLFAIAVPRVAATDVIMTDKQFDEAMKDSNAVIEWCWSLFEAPDNPENDDWMQPKIDLAYPRSMIKKYIGTDAVMKVFSAHAYVRTIMWEMFVQARRLGVLPPAEMRWLRFYDRETWYVLQNIMRQSGYAEGVSPLSHYYYEVKSKSPIVKPQIDKAVTGLEKALQSYQYDAIKKAQYEELLDADERHARELGAAFSRPDPEAIEQEAALRETLKKELMTSKMKAGKTAFEWLESNVLLFDTETTGLKEEAQLIEICIMDATGAVVLERRVRPSVSIEPEAMKVHGISMSDLANEPQWHEIWSEIADVLQGRALVAYNADYDMRILRSTQRAYGLPMDWIETIKPLCAMRLAKEAYDSPKNVRLQAALEAERLTYSGNAHAASVDTKATLDWLQAIAASYRNLRDEIADLGG